MPGNPKLVVLSEGHRGQQYELTEESYQIGRTEDCNVRIEDPTVSSLHCELIRNEDGSYTARDAGSTNGTRINGVRITEQRLNASDILQVGGVELLVDTEDTQMHSTKTVVNINQGERIKPNKMQSLDPTHDTGIRTDDPRVRMAFRLIITLLVLVVLVLLVVLVMIIMDKSG